MNATTFIAATGNGPSTLRHSSGQASLRACSEPAEGTGLARAERKAEGDWSVEFLLAGQGVRCLAADPLNSNVVYAGVQHGGVLRSDDRGKTWRPAGLAGKIVKSLAVSRAPSTGPSSSSGGASGQAPSGTIYAGTKPALMYVSRDGGDTWTELEAFRRIRWRWLWLSLAEPLLRLRSALPSNVVKGQAFTAYVQAIALSPADPNVIVVGIEAGAVVRTTDGGKTWTGHRKGALRDCHSLTFHATNGDWVYEAGGTGGGAAVSRDAGDTWRQPRDGLDRHYGWACAADPALPEVWYVSASPGAGKVHSESNAQAYIFRSVGGAPWQKLGGGLPQPLNYMPCALLTDPAAPGHVCAGLSNGEVWHSADHGERWEKLPFNLGGIHRTLIMV